MKASHKYAAFVGIDWADESHEIYLAANGQNEQRSVAQCAEDLEAWANDLRTRFGGQPVAICLEQSRGALVYALLKYDFLVLFPINPKQLARFREAFAPSGAKDDPVDALRLCQFISQYHEQLRPWRPDDEGTRILRLLTEDRRRWVDERTALGNQLRQRLKEYFPLALQLAGSDIYAAWFLHLLKKFSSHQELRRASPKTLTRLLPKLHRAPDDEVQDPRITTIRSALPLVTDPGIVLGHQMAVQQLVKMISQLNESIAQYDVEIAKQMATHPETALFKSFPAAGEALAPRLVAAFGTDRDRYDSADDLQQFTGIAPVTIRSGKSCIVRRRRACPKFLLQTYHEYADHSRKKSAWAQAYYRMLREQGTKHNAALRCLAYKWQRIMFRCWKDHTPYDEQRYLSQLRTKDAKLLKYLATEITTQTD
jgi:transposase